MWNLSRLNPIIPRTVNTTVSYSGHSWKYIILRRHKTFNQLFPYLLLLLNTFLPLIILLCWPPWAFTLVFPETHSVQWKIHIHSQALQKNIPSLFWYKMDLGCHHKHLFSSSSTMGLEAVLIYSFVSIPTSSQRLSYSLQKDFHKLLLTYLFITYLLSISFVWST